MNESISERWSTLSFLGTCYFDEDWPEDYGLDSAVVAVFLAAHPELGHQLAAEVYQVLAIYSEEELHGVFDAIDLNVAPTADLCTHRTWLTQLALRASGKPPDRGHQFESGPGVEVDGAWWPALGLLGMQYFRDGWLERYGLSPYVVDAFMSEQPVLAMGLADEIDRVLAEFREIEIGDLLRGLGFDYEPTASLNTNRGWLTEMAKYVRRALNQRS